MLRVGGMSDVEVAAFSLNSQLPDLFFAQPIPAIKQVSVLEIVKAIILSPLEDKLKLPNRVLSESFVN